MGIGANTRVVRGSLRRSGRKVAVTFGLFAFLVGAEGLPSARADVSHVIARGHTLEAIAHRYHVSVKAILEANHLKDTKHLKVGDTLTIPVEAKEGKDAKGAKAAPGAAKTPGAAKDSANPAKTTAKDAKAGNPSKGTFTQKPKTPGVVHITRVATKEELTVRVKEKSGKQSPVATKQVEKIMHAPTGQVHAVDSRLIALLGIVSDHFGSRRIEVVSGFRPYTPTQYTPHSNHNHGKAVDFRVVGVPNEVVRDFCRTLRNTGCGYYPNSVFVHMDVRDKSTYWIDYSKPGEAPRYHSASPDADESTSDVHGDAPQAAPAPASSDDGDDKAAGGNTAPPTTPSEAPKGGGTDDSL